MEQRTHLENCETHEALAMGALQRAPSPLTSAQASALQEQLQAAIAWQQDSFTAFDRRFSIPRLQAWFADFGISYRYADNLLQTQAWLPELARLKHQIEKTTGYRFNAILATLYRNGADSVGWHADDEQELGPAPVIASYSLGTTRHFEFIMKQNGTQEFIQLQHNDLLLMLPLFQQNWLHRVPAEPHIDGARINLTFRYVLAR